MSEKLKVQEHNTINCAIPRQKKRQTLGKTMVYLQDEPFSAWLLGQS